MDGSSGQHSGRKRSTPQYKQTISCEGNSLLNMEKGERLF